RRIAISLIVKREALPDQLRLRLQCPAFAQRDRIAPFKRSRNPMSVEVDTLATIRGRITTEPRSHQYGVEVPALRSYMRPISAETRPRNFEIPDSEIVPAKCLPGDVPGRTRIARKQAETVKMSAIRLATQIILSSLNTKELS